MLETALPNLHPAVIHFPIALVPLALLLEIVALARRADPRADRLAAIGWGGAALAVTAAFLAGRMAADGLVDIPPQVQPHIGDHADWAGRLLGITWTATIARVALTFGDQGQARWGTVGRALVVLVGLALQWVLFQTADHGGALVYQHAVAVTVAPCPECEASPEPAVEGEPVPIVAQPDGRLVWAPSLTLPVNGSHTILLEPVLESVQVDASVDLSAFEGTLSVLHHAGKDGSAGAYAVNTGGKTRLFAISGAGAEEVFDRGPAPSAFTAVSVSAAGTHLKGLIDGKVVTHGHAPALSPGRVGLRFEGTGVVLIHRIEAIPLGGH